MKFPEWIIEEVKRNKKDLADIPASKTKKDLKDYRLHTVCDEALCPNRGDCFKNGEATFLILGDRCTRACAFCAVNKNTPQPPDAGEPDRIAELVKKWGLKYVVFTSPTRDDLPDGGAGHYAETIKAIKKLNPGVKTEPLIPDFKGDIKALETALKAGPDVLAHNIEMVERLYPEARKGADYGRSLALLSNCKKINPAQAVKSGIMLGLGESKEEIKATIKDLKAAGCDLLNLGQYLPPGERHYPVSRYYTPAEFMELKDYALSLGFKGVLSGPLVRSSYKAAELYKKAGKRDKQSGQDKEGGKEAVE
ncbi:MAG: lipoyl synthase [Elusimicrobia bacterium CG08_land_8_20_14_0_20_51_18]|nr:MAG: lipoyl synthase [Elusimicrobia bacterium CG08_land_8_20_14_0_20_51_18]